MISLDISKCYGFDKHRSGWGYCINSLRPFHSHSGIHVDGFVEHNFCWHIEDYFYGGAKSHIPYKKSWIGFIHNPPNPPNWFDMYNSPVAMFSGDHLGTFVSVGCLTDMQGTSHISSTHLFR